MKNYQTETSDSVFLLLVTKSIQYILSKKIDKKKQKEEIEEMGFQLGEKVCNNLLNDNDFKFNFEGNSTTPYIQFLAQPLWNYIFKNGYCEINVEKNTTNYILTSADIKIFNFLVSSEGNQNDEKLEAVLNFISGIIKGSLSVFNIECIVIPGVTNYNQELVKNFKSFPESQFIFTFNVNLFLNNSNSDQIIDKKIVEEKTEAKEPAK